MPGWDCHGLPIELKGKYCFDHIHSVYYEYEVLFQSHSLWLETILNISKYLIKKVYSNFFFCWTTMKNTFSDSKQVEEVLYHQMQPNDFEQIIWPKFDLKR